MFFQIHLSSAGQVIVEAARWWVPSLSGRTYHTLLIQSSFFFFSDESE
jgi:hypothetical protein